MCIAFLATKEQGLPTDETLAHIYKSNPDGAGYVSVFTTPTNERKQRMEKGIMTYAEFSDKLKKAYADMNSPDDYIVAHTRIATSGGISKEKTHPFMMANGSFLFHNGVASAVTAFLHDKESDTEWLAKHCNTIAEVIDFDTISRYLVVKPDGTYDITDNWVKDNEGRLWTNNGFLPYRPYYINSRGHGYYGDYYGGYHGYDDEYFDRFTKPSATKYLPPATSKPTTSIVDVTLGEIADANKDSTACADGSCTINTPYTRRDFARYELLKGLSREKTMRRIEQTIRQNNLEYDREADAWFNGMTKIDLKIKGGNVVIRDITTKPNKDVPLIERLRDYIIHQVNGKLKDVCEDIGVDPETLYKIEDIAIDVVPKHVKVIFTITDSTVRIEYERVYMDMFDASKILAGKIYDDIFNHYFA